MPTPRALLVLLFAGALAACGASETLAGQPLATGATCPPGSTLTYASFGQAFFGTYCTTCHDSALSGAARNGAPESANFDTLAGIRDHRLLVDAYAGSGPNGTFTIMPATIVPAPEPPQAFPTVEERALLSEWIACGLD